MDIALDKTYNIKITADGDFAILKQSTSEQDVALCLESQAGEFKEHPEIGVGVANFANSTLSDLEITADVELGLERLDPEGVYSVEIDQDKNITVNKL